MAADAPSASSTRPVTPTPSDTSAADGPVLSVINKRLRALRKKHNRIIQMEESVAQGKVLNKEQAETLKSKPVVLAQIEELEKLKQPLVVAVGEEHSVAVKKFLESEKDKEARVSGEEEYVVVEEVKDRSMEEDRDEVIGDVLKLLYFGSIFDVKSQSQFTSTMLTRTHERGCCLTYDRVTDDAVEVLVEEDLDFISRVGSFLTSRPMDSSLSHKDALERCVEHAKLWLAKSGEPIGPDATITYAGLRERLNKIMASEYFTTTPEMKAPVDVAAAAAENYRSYELPVQGSSVGGHGEGSVSLYEHQDEVEHYQGQEIGENELSHSEEAHKEEVDGGHSDVSYLQEHDYSLKEMDQNRVESQKYVEHDYNLKEMDQNQVESQKYVEHDYSLKEMDQNRVESQKYAQRRGNQYPRGGRGGGRRGYPNERGFRGGSRGNGPYQNGRSQYYDQPGNYYPRNNYRNRGRGGRGSGGRGYNEYADAVHPSGDTGIAY